MTIDREGFPSRRAQNKEKLVPTEILQGAQTWTTLQTSIPNETSYEFTLPRDWSVLFIGESFCIHSSQYSEMFSIFDSIYFFMDER